MAVDWESFIDEFGDLELGSFLYETNLHLMKSMLDMGTMVCENEERLGAYRRAVKELFKTQWLLVAQCLEEYGVIVRCICDYDEFCHRCRGSRYLLNTFLTENEIRDISLVVNDEFDTPELRAEMYDQMQKAMLELKRSGVISRHE